MKRKLLLASAFAAAFALGQNTADAQSISVGPRVGVNFSHQAISGAESNDDKEYKKDFEDVRSSVTGLNVGAVINIGINDMFSIQPEILFSQKGNMMKEKETYTEEEDFVSGSAEYKLTETWNYLEVPVLAKASFGGENMKFFVNAGPTFSYLMSGKLKMETKYSGDIAELMNESGTNEEEDFDFDENAKDANRMDVGLSIGAGVGLNAGPGMLNIEARYGHGLSDLMDMDDPSSDLNYRNRTIGVSVSYLFSLGN